MAVPPGLPPDRGEECARPCRRRRSGVALEEGERRASGEDVRACLPFAHRALAVARADRP